METNWTTAINRGRQESNQQPQIPLLAGNRTDNGPIIVRPSLSPEPRPTFGYCVHRHDYYCSCYPGNQTSNVLITNLSAITATCNLPLTDLTATWRSWELNRHPSDNRTTRSTSWATQAYGWQVFCFLSDEHFCDPDFLLCFIMCRNRIIWKHAAALTVYATWAFFK